MMNFESVRAKVESFCNERDWNQYHTPINLALALFGECGEVCEIFQWKGFVASEDVVVGERFKPKEIVNIGEELADVFIYLCRLSDMCCIDLARCVFLEISRQKVGPGDGPNAMLEQQEDSKWTSLPLNFLESYPDMLLNSLLACDGGPRQTVLGLVHAAGCLSKVFLGFPEHCCPAGLPDWTIEQRNVLSTALASVAMHVALLARQTKVSLSEAIRDKFGKNEAKYPAGLVRGSSEKYSHYKEQTQAGLQQQRNQGSCSTSPYGFLMGAALGLSIAFVFLAVRRS